ncbi:MAG: ABC-type phosphate transport system substrate-binding protein [Pirellulaceae bacterium]|jgi:ABC-type phosphate transport system substrate-binding protein
MTRSLVMFFAAVAMCASISGCGGGGSETKFEIIRVSRQNNSGTYHYFRERVVGKDREFKLGSIDQSGSKDVVELVAKTPAAIGYSGMGYATPEVKMLSISEKQGGEAAAPNVENAKSGKYPIARPLYIYVLGEPEGAVKHYIDWVRSQAGQDIVTEIGYVPVAAGPAVEGSAPEGDATLKIAGSDTMVNLAQAWAETYTEANPNIQPQVSGGGSGTGIAKLIDGTVDMANASREMKEEEKKKAEEKSGKKVVEIIVGLDALAVYVHKENPLESISIEELAEIYGDEGEITDWTQLKGWPKNGE